jgi:hypothetical protein
MWVRPLAATEFVTRPNILLADHIRLAVVTFDGLTRIHLLVGRLHHRRVGIITGRGSFLRLSHGLTMPSPLLWPNVGVPDRGL